MEFILVLEVGVIKMLGDMYYTHIYIGIGRHVSREVLIEKVTLEQRFEGRKLISMKLT